MSEQFKAVTRKDVAHRAGVSETIVSYVLNNNRYVASDKRQRVVEAVKELNYKPNNIARALKGKKSNQILFIADDIANEHFGNLVKYMDESAYDKGYIISLLSYRDDEGFIPAIIQRHIDGIIISSTRVTLQVISQFCDAGIPVLVLQNKYFSDFDPRAVRIYTGLHAGIKELVKRFIDADRKDLLYIDKVRSDGRKSDNTDMRFKAFCEGMKENGIDYDDDSIVSGCKSDDELHSVIRNIFLSGKHIDGIICRNDRIAAVALKATLSVGVKVPEDVSITGFDDSVISRIVTPSLSTMQIDRENIGKKIVDILDSMINNNFKANNYKERFPSTYIKRETTDF